MKKIITLSIADFKNILRDPMLKLILFLPLFIPFVLHFILIRANTLIPFYFPDFTLSKYYDLILGIILLITPMLYGAVIGFILLDERDEQILTYISVTPLTKTGHLAFKVLSSMVISFFLTFYTAYAVNLLPIKILHLIPIAFMAAIETSIIALFLAAFSNNKVEGLVYGKALGIVFVAPAIGYFFKSKWSYLAGIFPPYWIGQAFVASYQNQLNYWIFISGGIGIHLLFLALFLYIYTRKVG